MEGASPADVERRRDGVEERRARTVARRAVGDDAPGAELDVLAAGLDGEAFTLPGAVEVVDVELVGELLLVVVRGVAVLAELVGEAEADGQLVGEPGVAPDAGAEAQVVLRGAADGRLALLGPVVLELVAGADVASEVEPALRRGRVLGQDLCGGRACRQTGCDGFSVHVVPDKRRSREKGSSRGSTFRSTIPAWGDCDQTFTPSVATTVM